jgi:hypothetical protein
VLNSVTQHKDIRMNLRNTVPEVIVLRVRRRRIRYDRNLTSTRMLNYNYKFGRVRHVFSKTVSNTPVLTCF